MSFHPPGKRADGAPLDYPITFEILAFLAEKPSLPQPAPPRPGRPPSPTAGEATAPARSIRIPEREAALLMKRARAVRSVTIETPPKAHTGGPGQTPGEEEKRSGPAKIEVRLGPGDFRGARLESSRLTAGVAVIDARGRRCAPEDLAVVDPVPPPPPPVSLAAKLTAEGVKLSWAAPDLASYPRAYGPAHLALYRWREEESEPSIPTWVLGPGETEFTDKQGVAGETLSYSLRLGIGEAASRRESTPAGPVRVEVKDLFAPAPPHGLSTATEPGIIRLFWYPSEESDIAGYRLYRAESGAGEFRPVTTGVIPTTSYEDRQIEGGRTYSYRVTAVDRAIPPNESAPSETVVETAMSAEGGGEP